MLFFFFSIYVELETGFDYCRCSGAVAEPGIPCRGSQMELTLQYIFKIISHISH